MQQKQKRQHNKRKRIGGYLSVSSFTPINKKGNYYLVPHLQYGIGGGIIKQPSRRANDQIELGRFLQKKGFMLKKGKITHSNGNLLSAEEAVMLAKILKNWIAKYSPEDRNQ